MACACLNQSWVRIQLRERLSSFSDAFASLWVLKSPCLSIHIEVTKLNPFYLLQHDQNGSGAYPASFAVGIGVTDTFLNCNWVDTRWQYYSRHLHTNNTQNNTINLERVRVVPRLGELYPGICLTTEVKARKNLSEGSRRVPVGTMKTESV